MYGGCNRVARCSGGERSVAEVLWRILQMCEGLCGGSKGAVEDASEVREALWR